MSKATIQMLPSPLVSWKFVCKTPAAVRANQKLAKIAFKKFLEGYHAGRKDAKLSKFNFVVTDNVLRRNKTTNIFFFEPIVKRRPGTGGTEGTPKAMTKPTQPTP